MRNSPRSSLVPSRVSEDAWDCTPTLAEAIRPPLRSCTSPRKLPRGFCACRGSAERPTKDQPTTREHHRLRRIPGKDREGLDMIDEYFKRAFSCLASWQLCTANAKPLEGPRLVRRPGLLPAVVAQEIMPISKINFRGTSNSSTVVPLKSPGIVAACGVVKEPDNGRASVRFAAF